MSKLTVRDMATIGIFAAIMAICSWISIPVFAVPFTLQTFAVEFALYTLGGAHGFLAIAVYLLLGFIGLPVFSGFNGGAGYLLGPTGGYLLGFLVTALIWMVLEKKCAGSFAGRIGGMIAAAAGCYAVGTVWFFLFYGRAHGMNIGAVLGVCVVPFLIPDACKLLLAEIASSRVSRAVRIGKGA